MSETIQQKQIEYFTKYAGSCLEIWNSIVGQQITHYISGPGAIVGIKKNNDSIDIEVLFTGRQKTELFLVSGKKRNLSDFFTHLTLPKEVKKDFEIHYWGLERFSVLSKKAMNPNVKACLPLPVLNEDDIQLVRKWYQPPLPVLNEDDIQLVGKWYQPPLNNCDRKFLIKNYGKDWELGRLLSARSAEKIAMDFYQNYGKEVKDISITQTDENNDSDWKKYDLDVDGLHVDVKNSRQSQKSKNRYTEYCIPQYKQSRKNQNVTISGIFSPYLWAFELLGEPVEHHRDREIQFLGETTLEKQQALESEFNDNNLVVDFAEPSRLNKHFLPPWVFDYPKYVYTERDKVRKELSNSLNLALLKDKPDLIPVAIVAGIDVTKILDREALDCWEWSFLHRLCNRIKKYGLSLPFLFLTILEHFLDIAASPKTVSDFRPGKYRKFLSYKSNNPLGIYDPLKTIDALINVLSILWTAESGLIRKFHSFKLVSVNILRGKSNLNDSSWTTLIAYCGGRLENGSSCGKNPLVLGESELCERRRLICPDCGFCCETCKEELESSSTHAAPTRGSKPSGASRAGESDFAI